MATHLCRDCGLMGLRNRDGNLIETGRRWRESPPGARLRNDGAELLPLCLMGIRNFAADYKRIGNSRPGAAPGATLSPADVQGILIEMLDEPQDCDEWGLYIEGTTPKEHRTILDHKRMLAQEEKRRRSDQRARRQELEIARDAAHATKKTARYQAVSVLLAAVAIAISAWAVLRDDRADVHISTVPSLTSPQIIPDASPEQP